MSRHVKAPTTELEQVFRANRVNFALGIQAYAFAIARREQVDKVRDDLRTLYWQSFALADIVGRRRLLMEADAVRDTVSQDLAQRVIFQDVSEVPEIPFDEAIDNISKREPRLADTADEVARIYRERAGFAAVRSTDIILTQKVQEVFVRMEERGVSGATATDVIEEMTDWTKGYSQTVYRTNLNTAYTAGRMEQVKDPAVAAVIGAFEVSAVTDSDVRRGRKQDGPKDGPKENHLAAHGFIAATNDPVWKHAATPHGYGCRCNMVLVSRSRLEAKGLIQRNGQIAQYHPKGINYFRANFVPHPRFGAQVSDDGRPDKEVYG